MQRRGGLAHSTLSFGRESGRQFTGFGRETKTIPPSGSVLQAQVHRNRTLLTASLKRREPTVIFALLGNLLF